MESYKVNTDGCVKDGFASGWEIIKDLSDLWIKVDSTLAIHCISRRGRPWYIQATLRQIRHLIAFDCDTISHIYRESNPVATYLLQRVRIVVAILSTALRTYLDTTAA
ncbi:Uncharacterized protein Adt_03114 [Abeliophyllum distichum]|uniref:RNase H type-1 domain-containing protein n=1 Tax=Abeliophyllum distichum TaxID=126358 RepID=A0ABD1VY35_9LAMI